MKKTIYVAAIIFSAALLSLPSCKKQTAEQDQSIESSEDVLKSEVDESDISVEELYVANSCMTDLTSIISPCATITESSAEFPKTVTVDFGTSGCTDARGRVKKGKIIIYATGELRSIGAERTVTFENFTVNDVVLTGERHLVNTGTNASGNMVISVSGNLAASGNGCTRSRTFQRQREWIAGAATCDASDDEFLITGSGTTVNRRGVSITHEITEAIHIKPGSCKYPVSGTVEVSNGKRGGTINFGDGTCDSDAIFTSQKRHKTYVIDLDTRKIVH